MARTFSDEDEAQLRHHHADGLTRNAIAREMGWSVGTITNHATRLGLAFDRSATRAATDARQIDLKDRRQRIQAELLDVATEQMTRARGRYQVVAFTPTGDIVSEWLRLPPARETKDLTTSAMSALARFDQKAKDDGDTDTDKAKAALGTLGHALSAIYGSADDYREPGTD
jgi:hypothetical protein